MNYGGPKEDLGICIHAYTTNYLRYRFGALYIRDLYSNIRLIHLVQCYIIGLLKSSGVPILIPTQGRIFLTLEMPNLEHLVATRLNFSPFATGHFYPWLSGGLGKLFCFQAYQAYQAH